MTKPIATPETVFLVGHKHAVNDICFAPMGALLASCDAGGDVYLWNVMEGTLIKTLEKHDCHVKTLAFSADGTLLASGDINGMIHLWDVLRGVWIRTFRCKNSGINELVFSPDGNLLASGNNNGLVCLWHVKSSVKKILSRTFWRRVGKTNQMLFNYGISALCFYPDGEQLLCCDYTEEIVYVWNIFNSWESENRLGHLSLQGPMKQICFTPNKEHVAALSYAGTLKFISYKNKRSPNAIGFTSNPIVQFAFSPRGDLVILMRKDGEICAFSEQDGVFHEFATQHRERKMFNLCSNGRYLAASGTLLSEKQNEDKFTIELLDFKHPDFGRIHSLEERFAAL